VFITKDSKCGGMHDICTFGWPRFDSDTDSLLAAVVPGPSFSSSRTSVAILVSNCQMLHFSRIVSSEKQVSSLELNSDGVRPFSSDGGGKRGGLSPESTHTCSARVG